MPWALEPIRIDSSRILIRTTVAEDASRVAEAIPDPKGWFETHWGLDSSEKIGRMIASRIAEHQDGTTHPLVYFAGQSVAGITRLFRFDAKNRSLEIGGTWVAPKWRRTFVNTEVKYLLLRHCFETLDAQRVELRVDAGNTVSQRAILRLGATLEGRLRSRQIYPGGQVRDGFLFSIVKPEWPRVKSRLEGLRSEPARASTWDGAALPSRLETGRLLLRPYALDDAPALFDLVDRNRADLTQSFPKTVNALRAPELAADHVVDLIHRSLARRWVFYGAFLKSTGQLVGQVHLKDIDWDVPSAELGYFIDARHRRTGLGREMVEAVAAQCSQRQGFKRLALRILPSNEPSLRLAKALGFESEGLRRNEFRTGQGELADIIHFVRTPGQGGTCAEPRRPPVRTWVRSGYEISTDALRLDLDFIHKELSRSYWAKGIPRELLEQAIADSLVCFGLYGHDGRQLGFARLVTDCATFAYLCDVIITETERGQGLGSWLSECIVKHPDLAGLRRWLLCTRDAQPIYAKSGWAAVKSPERFMERHLPDAYLIPAAGAPGGRLRTGS